MSGTIYDHLRPQPKKTKTEMLAEKLADEILAMRKEGMTVADIADIVYPGKDSGILEVSKILKDQPRRLKFRDPDFGVRGPDTRNLRVPGAGVEK